MKVEILEQFVEHEDEMKNILEDDEASHKNYQPFELNQELLKWVVVETFWFSRDVPD